MSAGRYIIYGLKDPRDGQLRYVGLHNTIASSTPYGLSSGGIRKILLRNGCVLRRPWESCPRGPVRKGTEAR